MSTENNPDDEHAWNVAEWQEGEEARESLKARWKAAVANDQTELSFQAWIEQPEHKLKEQQKP